MANERSATVSTRRDEILAVAARVFAEKGIMNATVRDIGQEAGILSGSLYHHFESKDQMIEEVLRPVVEHFDTVRNYTVNRPVYETHLQEQQYTVMRPVTRTFQVAIPYCTTRPVYETHVRDVTQTFMRPQSEDHS